jgi:hypothetical protein
MTGLSMSRRRAGRTPNVDFRGQTRTNDMHASTIEPEARVYNKAPGQPAELSHLDHVLMENRHSLAVQATGTPATGPAERPWRWLRPCPAVTRHAGYTASRSHGNWQRPRSCAGEGSPDRIGKSKDTGR